MKVFMSYKIISPAKDAVEPNLVPEQDRTKCKQIASQSGYLKPLV